MTATFTAQRRRVSVLVRMLRERWTEVASKSAIQPAELDEAEKLAEQINIAYGERTRQSMNVTKAGEDRQRAYTLLIKAYDQVRRAVTYVRWDQNDADKIVPSLWAGRGGRGSNANGSASSTDPKAGASPTCRCSLSTSKAISRTSSSRSPRLRRSL